MVEERAQRRLAAILAADVVGYSRLVQQNEVGPWTMLANRRQTILVLVRRRDAALMQPIRTARRRVTGCKA